MESESSSNPQIAGSPSKSEIRGLKSERKRKKLKVLKDENKHLKDLLKQISHTVSNSGLLNVEQQEALAEAIAREDTEMLDADLSMETVDLLSGNDFGTTSGSMFEPPNVGATRNPTLNCGFQFSSPKSSAVVMPSIKQTPGSNFFLNNLDEVVKDLDSADELDVTSFDLKSLREQICFRSVDFAPISPLPPTPPPKTINNNVAEDDQKHSAESNGSVVDQSEKHVAAKKKLSFNHQHSEGFDVPSDQNSIRLNSASVACSASVPASSISNAGSGKYEFVSKRSADGGVMLTFSLKDDISLNLDSNTWQITCHIPDPKRKQPECSLPNHFESSDPPGSQNFSNQKRNKEDGCVPFKRQKLSYSEEVPEMVLPSMQGVDISNFGKKSEHESRFLAPTNQSNPPLNNSALLLKEHSSFNQVIPAPDTENFFETPPVIKSSPKKTSTQFVTKSTENFDSGLKSNTMNIAEPAEKVVSCLDNDVDSNNDYDYLDATISLSPVSSVPTKHKSHKSYSRKQTNRSEPNVEEKKFLPSDFSSESSNNNNCSTDLKKYKQDMKKQRLTNNFMSKSMGTSISKSKNVGAKNKKNSKKLLTKVQKVESEESISTINSQDVEEIDISPSTNSLLGDFELQGSSFKLSSDEKPNSDVETEEITHLMDEISRNLPLEKKDESKTSLRKLELESSTELSSLGGKQNIVIKSESMEHLSKENEAESASFLRSLGLVSSSELSSQEEKRNSISSSPDKNTEVSPSPFEESFIDEKQSTPKKDNVLDKIIPQPSSDKILSDKKGKNSIDPNFIPDVENNTEEIADNSKDSSLNNDKESSLVSVKNSLPENISISRNRVGLRSSSTEKSMDIPEALPEKKSPKRRMSREVRQISSDSTGSKVSQNDKRNGRNNSKCSPPENSRVSLRLRSSSQAGSLEKKQKDPQIKKKKSILGKTGNETSQDESSSPGITKCSRSRNRPKKVNKRKQCSPKTLKKTQSRKIQLNSNKIKAKVLNSISESDSENPVDEKLSNVNGDNSHAPMSMGTNIDPENRKILDVNNKKDERSGTKTGLVNGLEALIDSSPKNNLGETSSSLCNSEQQIIPEKDLVKDPKTSATSVQSASSKSLFSSNQRALTRTCPSAEIKAPVKIKTEPIDEIELDSFNPNAFTSNCGANRFQNKASDILSTDLLSSKNLLANVKFSFLNSNGSLGKVKQEKINSHARVSFQGLHAYARNISSTTIKKELPDAEIQNNDVVSEENSQNSGSLQSDSSPNGKQVKIGSKDDNLVKKGFTESSHNGRSSGKETSNTSEYKSTSSDLDQSSSLNSEKNGANYYAKSEDSEGEGALVIADDAEPELNQPEERLVNFSAVSPQKKKKKGPAKINKKSRRTSSTDCATVETGINAAFKHLDKMKYSDEHSNYNTHFLYSAFINPDYPMKSIIFTIIEHLSTSKRNPLLSYSLNRDSPLLPLPEDCIVTALLKASTKTRLARLLPSTKRSLYNIILAKHKISIYGLCSMCRVFTEICKRKKEKKEVISFCCDLILQKHKFASYMIASITGLWKDLFKPSETSSDEERIFFGVVAMIVNQKPSSLTPTQWNHCSVVLSETMTEKLSEDIKSIIEILKEKIEKKCVQEKFANSMVSTTSLKMIAQMQEWSLTKKLILDSFVIPCLHHFLKEEKNERAFSVFCSLYGDICALCPDLEEPKELLINLFESRADNNVQLDVAVTLLQLYLGKQECFPDFLGSWLGENQFHPKVSALQNLFHQNLIADGELLPSDICLV